MSQSLFYTSPITVSSKPPRGGVPVLFPQFADRGPLKKHGYARDHEFRLVETSSNNGIDSLVTELHILSGTWPSWPFSALIRLHQTTYDDGAEFRLEIQNLSSEPFEWSGGLHPYFQVGDLRKIELYGLNDVSRKSKLNTGVVYGEQGQIIFDSSEFETLFLTANSLRIVDPVASREMRLECFGFQEWMVWNPGNDLCTQLGDLPADDWKRFLCIEPVAAESKLRLEPGHLFTGGFKVFVTKI